MLTPNRLTTPRNAATSAGGISGAPPPPPPPTTVPNAVASPLKGLPWMPVPGITQKAIRMTTKVILTHQRHVLHSFVDEERGVCVITSTICNIELYVSLSIPVASRYGNLCVARHSALSQPREFALTGY